MTLALFKRAPKVIGRYEVLEKLGKAGVGSVFKALDPLTGVIVAIKVIKPEWTENPKLQKRFQQEFKAASTLDHPNLVRALAYNHDGSLAYLVMEYVDGESLGDRIEREGRLPELVAIRIMTQIAQALHYAHGRQIIHRDVKPDNILLRTDGHAKLTDFGLVKDMGEDQDLTRPATGLGSPHFMPPEQYADAKNASVRCDIYSLAATLYMAVTGRLPFHGCGSLTALTQKLKGDVIPPRHLVPTLSEQTDRAIRRAMSPDPSQRPDSCLEFVKDLVGKRKAFALDSEYAAARTGSNGSSAASRFPNRRAFVRHQCVVGTNCLRDTTVHPGGRPTTELEELWPAIVMDISTGGIGLSLARRFEPDTLLTVELDGDGPKSGRTVVAQVVHVRPEEVGHWFHGCSLATALNSNDLHDVIEM